MRALASHQCGPGSNPGVDAICGLSLLLVLSFAPRGFSPGTPVFPSPQKPTFPNSNSTRNQVDEEPLCGCATCKSLFIYYLFILFTFKEVRCKTFLVKISFLCIRKNWFSYHFETEAGGNSEMANFTMKINFWFENSFFSTTGTTFPTMRGEVGSMESRIWTWHFNLDDVYTHRRPKLDA